MEVKTYISQPGKNLSSYNKGTVEQTNHLKVIGMDCDIFAPCAGDGTLSASVAKILKSKVVIEGANGPTTFAADEILKEKKVLVIPDMLANVGGVTVSYFEWLKNLDHVAPGRMTSKNKENQNKNLIKLLGKTIPEDKMHMLKGAKEIDLVISGLEEIMVNATKENWKYARQRNLTMREACLGNALKKLASHFQESGLMMS